MSGNGTRERRLLGQLRDLREAAASLPEALVLLGPDSRVRWFNASAKRLLGLVWPRDRGIVLARRYAGHALGAWLCSDCNAPLEDVSAPTDPTLRLQVAMIPHGARQRWLRARDISHLTRLEQVRRDFVANVSHELRTPLTVIHGYLELLDPADVPALAPVLDEMRAQSERMRQLVEDLLTLSRLEMQQRLPQESVPMSALLTTLRHEAKALSHGHHRVVLEDAAHLDLLGSPKDLHSAFSNLVSNAARYTPDGGTITIRWQRTATGAEYSVSDTGYGIPAEHVSRLTERFYRVSSSRSRGSGGTGLGLSIVKHVLSLHHAELRIESVPGHGSTFTCAFDRSLLLEPATGG